MGNCASLYCEDEDDIARREREKQWKRDYEEYTKQLRKQKCHSELDLSGKATSRQLKDERKREYNLKQKRDQRDRTEKRQATAEEIRFATDVLYDA